MKIKPFIKKSISIIILLIYKMFNVIAQETLKIRETDELKEGADNIVNLGKYIIAGVGTLALAIGLVHAIVKAMNDHQRGKDAIIWFAIALTLWIAIGGKIIGLW